MHGNGLLLRDVGRLSPKVRKLLEQVGNEKVNSVTLFRKPISLSAFAKFVGVLKNTGYDDLLHLGMIINNKYLLDKQDVIHFERSSLPTGKDVESIDVKVDKDITINQLLEKTRKRMGDSDFTNYSSKNNNCQDFILNILAANGLSTSETTKFVKQDLQKVFNNLPSYAEKIANAVTEAGRVLERIQEGEGYGAEMHNFQLHRAKCKF
jgi:hypothetical protein